MTADNTADCGVASFMTSLPSIASATESARAATSDPLVSVSPRPLRITLRAAH